MKERVSDKEKAARIASFVNLWIGFFGITGGAPTNPCEQWTMLELLRKRSKCVDEFICDASDADIDDAMLAVYKHYAKADQSMQWLWSDYQHLGSGGPDECVGRKTVYCLVKDSLTTCWHEYIIPAYPLSIAVLAGLAFLLFLALNDESAHLNDIESQMAREVF